MNQNSAQKLKPAAIVGTQQATPVMKKLGRAEKAQKNRIDLINAAVEIIGERGYADASVSRITERAGLAAGTFYRYFESRQALFDMLLPEMARDALSFISPQVHGSTDIIELEKRGLHAMLAWEETHPGLARIRNEAEIAAPAAFKEYLSAILERYTRALSRGQQQGYLLGYDDNQIKLVACMLIGARHYLHYAFPEDGGQSSALEEAYVAFVEGGLKASLPR